MPKSVTFSCDLFVVLVEKVENSPQTSSGETTCMLLRLLLQLVLFGYYQYDIMKYCDANRAEKGGPFVTLSQYMSRAVDTE